ncbi:hypothetical protein NE865_08393 [Phthorimaea operculella]|nr:hypothetical protein NE865_08393 [Phthorimaea operculella]
MASQRLKVKQKLIFIACATLVCISQCFGDNSFEFPDERGYVIDTGRDDEFNVVHEGMNIKDYCPAMPHCPEGSHILCLYFDQHRTENSMCYNFRQIPMYKELKENILTYVNEIRGKVARGVETRDKDNVPMPRGYTLFKVKWDKELATLAKLGANMCIMKPGLCVATYKFPNAITTSTAIKMTIPDWQPIENMKRKFRTKGFNWGKVDYAIREMFKYYYSQKYSVTSEHLKGTGFNNYTIILGKAPATYLAMISDVVTHIGCGMSTFVNKQGRLIENELQYQDENYIWITCNLSSGLKVGKPIYRTDKPTIKELCKGDKICKKRYDSKCGCPPGIAEDDRCLCTDPIVYPPPPPDCGIDTNCKPSVVLVPIVKVVDDPPKMITRNGPPDNMTLMREMEGYNMPQEKESQFASIVQSHANRILPRKIKLAAEKSKPIIYAKVPKFGINDTFFKHVASERDFPMEQLDLNGNFQKRKSWPPKHFSDEIDDQKTRLSSAELKFGQKNKDTALQASNLETSTSHTNISLRNYVYDFEHDLTHKFNKNNTIEESDRFFLYLLNNLEQEVNNVDLDGIQTDIFDAKLKKIYGTVLKESEFPVSKDVLHDNEDDTSGFLENGNSELEQDAQMKINKLRNPYLHDFYKNVKSTNYSDFGNEFTSNYQFVQEKIPYSNDFVVTTPVNLKKTGIDENLHNTEGMNAKTYSNGNDGAFQTLYARPIPRVQSALRPTIENINYVYRNTLNNINGRKIRTPVIRFRNNQESRDSDYRLSKGGNHKRKKEQRKENIPDPQRFLTLRGKEDLFKGNTMYRKVAEINSLLDSLRIIMFQTVHLTVTINL